MVNQPVKPTKDSADAGAGVGCGEVSPLFTTTCVPIKMLYMDKVNLGTTLLWMRIDRA